MEYSIKIKFIKESASFEVSYEKLNFEEIIKSIIQGDFLVTKENILVEHMVEDSIIDVNVIKEILIEVHSNYELEIKRFHENILTEINTLSLDKDLEKEILNHLHEKYNLDISENSRSDV